MLSSGTGPTPEPRPTFYNRGGVWSIPISPIPWMPASDRLQSVPSGGGFSRMRIFLTGGTGYIGLALARRLVARRARGAGARPAHQQRGASAAARRRHLHGRPRGPRLDAGGDVRRRLGDPRRRRPRPDRPAGADAAGQRPGERERRLPRLQARRRALPLGLLDGLLRRQPAGRLGGGRDGPPPAPFPTLYSATKHSGELAIQEWAKKGLRVNTVYPSLVYGPPGKKEGANAILRGFLKGRYPVLVGARPQDVLDLPRRPGRGDAQDDGEGPAGPGLPDGRRGHHPALPGGARLRGWAGSRRRRASTCPWAWREPGWSLRAPLRDLFDSGKILRRAEISCHQDLSGPAVHEQLIRQTTRLGTLAAISAALAERLACQTLTRILDAKRAVDKNLDRKFIGRERL